MKQTLLAAFSYKNKTQVLNKNVLSVSKLSNSQFRITFTNTINNLFSGDTFFNYSCIIKSKNNAITTYKNNLPCRIVLGSTANNYIDIYVLNSELNLYGLYNDDLDINFMLFNDILDTDSHYEFFNLCINSSTVLSKSPLFTSISFDNSVLSAPIITCILKEEIHVNTDLLWINTSGGNWGEYVYYVENLGTQLKIYLKTAHGGDYYNPSLTDRHNLSLLIYS